jgi:hypothetical protein
MCDCWAHGWPNRRRVPMRASCRCTSPTRRCSTRFAPAMAAASTDTGVDARPQVVTTDAVVVLVSEKQKGTGGGSDRVVLVAVGAHDANAVAGAALVHTVTLTFH